MTAQAPTSRLLKQLRLVRASLPPARGLLPLVLLLLVWQLLQSGPSPYFPAPSQWWTATGNLLNREHLLAAFSATTLTFLEGLGLAIVLGMLLGVLIGIRIAIPLAIVITLLVEMLTSLPGIGAVMIRSQRNFQSSEVYALLVLVGLFGFVVNDLFAIMEGLIMRRWPPRA